MNSFKRQYQLKILASALLIVLSLSMLVMVTFAWYTMSTAPETAGMQIKIGSDTIQVAQDLKDESGNHYPGAFNGTLEVDGDNGLLAEFAGLLPVSTADGKHWYSATYEALEKGGNQKEEYSEDTELRFANQPMRPTSGGNYLYLDFWVVAPKDYELRVSTADKGSDQSGSFVKMLPQVTENNGRYTLDESQRQAETSVRIGFLVNQGSVSTEAYKTSDAYDSTYKMLKGEYQEQYKPLTSLETSFTIYEPNCDWHAAAELKGKYSATQPLALQDGKIQPVSLDTVDTKVAAQASSTWTKETDEEKTKLEQALENSLLEMKNRNKSTDNTEDVQQYLVDNELRRRISDYITRGQFIKSYERLQDNTTVDSVETAGATDDAVIVSLEKNVPQRIRMFVWLEGQDVDCTNEAATKTLFINLELAGQSKE